MTASKISQLAALLKASELVESQNKPQGGDMAFGALLNQAPDGQEKSLNAAGESLKGTLKPNSACQAAYEKGVAQLGYRDSSVSQKESLAGRQDLPQDTPEKLGDFEEKVTKAVAQELGVTEEEVAKQMEAMGLTALDLMDPSKLAGLALALTGGEDMGELLLSGGFQQLLGEVGEFSQALMAELGLTPQDMPQVMEQLEGMLPKGPETLESLPSVPEESEVQAAADQPTDATTSQELAQPILEGEEKAQQPEQNAGSVQAAVKAQDPTQEPAPVFVEEGEADQQAVSEAERQPEGEMQESLAEGEEGSAAPKEFASEAEEAKPQQGQVTYQTTAQTVSQGQAVEFTQTVIQTRVDVESIMRQISQMTRIVVSQAETSIEMQLDPENLGKVYLQIVSRQGAITAQLAAQDEAVKQALESQIAVLKENMNQQGLKVEAVEVTIASHEFERNLEENQKNPSQEQQEAEMGQRSRRNINLNSLDELEGLMSEEESLVAKIMLDQGNSVDLTA